MNTDELCQRLLKANRDKLYSFELPPLQSSEAATVPSWWAAILPSVSLHARVIDYWADSNEVSSRVVNYLRWLGFEVNFDTSRRQEPTACAFVAARVVNDLHAAGDAWFTQSCGRAADHEWVLKGNQLIGRREDKMDSGLMAHNDVIRTLVLRLWQEDVPDEPREKLWWLPTTFVTSLDGFMAELANDLHDIATQPAKKLPLRIRVSNTKESTNSGEHWFTIAYSVTLWNTNVCVAHEKLTHEDEETDGMDLDASEHSSNDSSDAMELGECERDRVDGCGYALHVAEGLSDDEAMADEVMAMFDFDGEV